MYANLLSNSFRHPLGQALNHPSDPSYIDPVDTLELLAESSHINSEHSLCSLHVAQTDLSRVHVGYSVHDVMGFINDNHVAL